MKRKDSEFLDATLPAADRIYSLARRCARNPQEAEDLVQETYIRALVAWRERRCPRNVDAWLATICLNIIRSNYRWRSRRPDELLQEDPAEWLRSSDVASDSTAEGALTAVQASDVHRALQSLPEQQRIAVALMDIAGLSASEVATVTGSPRGTVLSRVHRARKVLAGLLSSQRVREP